ncbi:ABC transporter permease, partial [Lacticaseibacillus rhamnosus MTCC 5462]
AILVYFGGDSQLSAQFFFSMLSPYVLFGSIYLFIRLAIKQEHTWVNNYYRAVPTTNLKLYVANLFSTVANFAFTA